MSGGDRTDLAEDRTDYAEDRTLLSHERSFAGWLRTGMAAVGIGLGFTALFQSMQPPWLAKAIASSFLLIAILVVFLAERRASATLARLEAHQIKALKAMRIRLIAWLLIVATLALLVAIWVAA